MFSMFYLLVLVLLDTILQKFCMKWSEGHKVVMYLDDGIGGSQTFVLKILVQKYKQT